MLARSLRLASAATGLQSLNQVRVELRRGPRYLRLGWWLINTLKIAWKAATHIDCYHQLRPWRLNCLRFLLNLLHLLLLRFSNTTCRTVARREPIFLLDILSWHLIVFLSSCCVRYWISSSSSSDIVLTYDLQHQLWLISQEIRIRKNDSSSGSGSV